jgi:uncharacterized protein
MLEFKLVAIRKPETVNIIIGQSHFIKTVEDIYEALIAAVPGIQFGVAFAEASGACKVRVEGTDEESKRIAVENILELAAGHVFIIVLMNAYPINILNAVKSVPEVCLIYCATANPVDVVIAQSPQGRGIMGVIDGLSPQGVETDKDIAWRKGLLRKIGYKL